MPDDPGACGNCLTAGSYLGAEPIRDRRRMKISVFVVATTICLAVAGLSVASVMGAERYYKAQLKNAHGFIGCEDGLPVVRNITFGARYTVQESYIGALVELLRKHCSDP